MEAKENAMRILRFDHPERIVREMPAYWLSYLGCFHESFTGGGDNSPAGTNWVDIWGTRWQKELEGVMGFPVGFPLAEVASLKKYHWPDPNDERICEKIYRLANEFPGGDLFLAGYHNDTVWEKAHMLVGMEKIMVYFFDEPGFVHELLHEIMDFHLGIAKHYLEVGVELVMFDGDMFSQRGPLLSPRIFNEFLLPEYERLFKFYKERNVLIEFHACGCVEPFLETFMKLGVDILDPIQATANNLDNVRSITHGRMALRGGVNSATIMAGPVERIEEEVLMRILQLGKQGGYFCDADQALPFPKVHEDALYSAIQKFSQYH